MTGLSGMMSATWGDVRRGLLLALSLVALVLQINAPIHATLMIVAAVDGSALCAEHQVSKGDQKAPDPQKACAACVVCVGGGGLALLPTPLLHLVRYAVAAPPAEIAAAIAARGPPLVVPKARGPPTNT
jgi:hypothetical protein